MPRSPFVKTFLIISPALLAAATEEAKTRSTVGTLSAILDEINSLTKVKCRHGAI